MGRTLSDQTPTLGIVVKFVSRHYSILSLCVCVRCKAEAAFVCVCVSCRSEAVCVCACERERERCSAEAAFVFGLACKLCIRICVRLSGRGQSHYVVIFLGIGSMINVFSFER